MISFKKTIYFFPCEMCLHKIDIPPIIEEWQGKYSVQCPYCLTQRAWGDTKEEAIEKWNEGTDNRLPSKK